jgi:Ca-activated chloride channel family protein
MRQLQQEGAPMDNPSSQIIRFAAPWFLLLLGLIPLLAFLLGRHRPRSSVTFAPLRFLPDHLKKPLGGARTWRNDWLRYAILATIILALARPQIPFGDLPDHADGIDVMLTLDFSKSMLAKDYTWDGKKTTRLHALVEVIKKFMEPRKKDRFGVAGFANFAYLASPLTLDQDWIKDVLDNIDTAVGTALGDGILLSVDYLQENPDRDKTIILVSDGLSNRGAPPLECAKYAATKQIRIYTVRVMPDFLPPGRFQENVMYRVAKETGGQFYQATDTASLQSIYSQIDQLEAKRIEQRRFQQYQELFPWLLGLAGILLSAELLLRQLVLRRVP